MISRSAERELGALHDNPHVQEPTRSWAGVEAMLAAFLDARSEDALKRARKLREHLHTLPSSHPLAGQEWDDLLEGLNGFRPLAAPQAGITRRHRGRGVACRPQGLGPGTARRGRRLFQGRRPPCELPPDEEWAAFYQKMAADHLHDHQVLSGPLFTVEPADRAGCEESIAQLDEVLATLKTRGRARFNVRAWQLDLKRRVVSFAAAEAGAPLRPNRRKRRARRWRKCFARLAEYTAGRRFAEFTTWLKELAGRLAAASPRNRCWP